MPELHKHGLELIVDLLDAADHLQSMPQEDVRRLLRDTADVLGDLLKRDNPPPLAEAARRHKCRLRHLHEATAIAHAGQMVRMRHTPELGFQNEMLPLQPSEMLGDDVTYDVGQDQ